MAVKKILSVKVSDLTLDPNNARKHGERDLAAIVASLEKFEQQTPIVITSDNVVIKGNGTVMAAMKLGWTHVEAIRTNLTGQQVTAYALADNQTGLLSTWDNEKLLELLQGLDEQSLIDACGFDEMAMAELMANLGQFDVEEVVEPVLADGDREPFQQMTFTLHDAQAETIKSAIVKAKAAGAFDGLNENSNGNALARIAEAYVNG